MFHDRHELNNVVPQLFDSGESILCELCISTDSVLSRGDAD